MRAPWRISLLMLFWLSLLTGIVYPLAVTALAQAAFPFQANGSLLAPGGTVRGSALLGQPFDDPRYFWGRPSATAPGAYNASASGGSNYGPLNPALAARVQARVAALRAADPGNAAPVPVDLVTASASGLDPHISPAAAYYQAARVALARHMDAGRVRALIDGVIEGRDFGVLGEPRVNVLRLNMALDGVK